MNETWKYRRRALVATAIVLALSHHVGASKEIACIDDQSFQWNGDPMLDCESYLQKHTNKRCHRKQDGIPIRDICRATCGACEIGDKDSSYHDISVIEMDAGVQVKTDSSSCEDETGNFFVDGITTEFSCELVAKRRKSVKIAICQRPTGESGGEAVVFSRCPDTCGGVGLGPCAPSSSPSVAPTNAVFADVSHKIKDYASDEFAHIFTSVPWKNFLGPITFDVNGDGFPDMLSHHHVDRGYFALFPELGVGGLFDLATTKVNSNNEVTYKAAKVDVTYKATVPDLDGEKDPRPDATRDCIKDYDIIDGSIVDTANCINYPDLHGTIVLDFDRDGILDALVTIGGGSGKGEGTGVESMLFWGDDATPSNATENKGILHFTGGRGTLREAGISSGEPQRTYGVYAADFNNDGFLDFFFINKYRKQDLKAPGMIYMSRGASEPRRFDAHPEVSEFTNAALLTDFDQDGFANELLVLQQPCREEGLNCTTNEAKAVVYKWDASIDRFANIWESSSLSDSRFISTASGDFNGDGLTDIVILKGSEEASHLEFWYSSEQLPLSLTVVVQIDCNPRHTLRAADFDLDGVLDLLVLCHDSSIRIYKQLPTDGNWSLMNADFLGPIGNSEYIRDSTLAFYDRCYYGDDLDQCEIDNADFLAEFKLFNADENGEFTNTQVIGQGATVFDYNNDGFMDVFLEVKGGLNMLFENKGSPGKRYLSFKLEGTTSNINGIGAVAVLTWKRTKGVKNTVQLWEHNCQSFESDVYGSRDSRIVFGLGETGVPQKLEVRWPSGKISILEKEELFKKLPATMNYNEITTITEPE
jgi:hypothetical protein